MVDNETLKLELELELKRTELEILELEVEIHKNNIESIKYKEKIEHDEDLPEVEVESFIESCISGTNSNNDVLLDNIMLIGALTYKNYCLEDHKFSLLEFQKTLNKQLGRPEED